MYASMHGEKHFYVLAVGHKVIMANTQDRQRARQSHTNYLRKKSEVMKARQ